MRYRFTPGEWLFKALKALRLSAIVIAITGCAAGNAADLLDSSNLTLIDGEYDAGTWAAANLNDGNASTLWLSGKQVNDLNYVFSPTKAAACFSSFELSNYGSSRSINEFMLLTTLDETLSADGGSSGWTPIPADANPSGPIDHLRWAQGGRLVAIDAEYDAETWAAENIYDGDSTSLWLSYKATNSLEFAFDTDWDGSTGDAINIKQLEVLNYGNTRAVAEFQVEVTSDGLNWSKLEVPGSAAGDGDFNFLLAADGGTLTAIDGEYDNNSWAASNIHDGDANSRWLNGRSNNTLDFSVDADGDGSSGAAGDSDDYFTLEKIYLRNYGADDRAVRQFQVEVKTSTDANWRKLEVPGSSAGEADHDFLLGAHGGVLTSIDSQYDNDGWAASNLHDGDQNSLWLSYKGNNSLDFAVDADDDGTTGAAGDTDDYFQIDSLYLQNYGTDDRAVRLFQVEVKTSANAQWSKLEVPGSVAGESGYNFVLAANGGSLSAIDSQYNSTSYAASNLHDGDQNSRWLSTKATNTLEFSFDTDQDGSAGDGINLDTVELINYGVNDISVQTFELDIRIGAGPWQAVNAPGGGTLFSANMDANGQAWAVGPHANVTAVRLRTLSNHGDSSYTGATEVVFSGDSLGPSHTFTAAMHGNGESFLLDGADRPVNVTAVRFRSINNHGDPSYIGARHFSVLGSSVAPGHTFTAAMHGDGETFALDVADQPANVTAVRFRSISNHGDPSYTGAREFQVLGPSPRPNYTFSIPLDIGPHTIVLDAEDQASGVVGARLLTIANHGHASYTGLRELSLLGDPVGPDYVFSAAMSSSAQTFSFDQHGAKVFRFHTLNNHGDASYSGAAELALEESPDYCAVASCPLGGFQISQAASGIACPTTRAAVNIVAMCEDGTTVKTDYLGSVDLTAASGSAFYLAAAGGSPLTSYSFSASDDGSTTLYLFHDNVADDVRVSVSDSAESVSSTAASGTRFGSAGLRIASAPGDFVCGQQTSLALEAFGQVTGGACDVLTDFSGAKGLKLWFDAELDGSAGYDSTVSALSINGTAIAARTEPASNNLVANFVAGQSTLTLAYTDAAKIASLHLRHDQAPYDGAPFSPLLTDTGSFVVSPQALDLALPALTGPADLGAASALFKKAGETFVTEVSALCSDGSRARQYLSQADIALAHSLKQPLGGVTGTLAVETARVGPSSSNGVETISQAVSEVGIFDLTATLPANSYFGATIAAAVEPNVGRFAPSHFQLSSPLLTNRSDLGACSDTFSYQGETLRSQFTLTAQNSDGATTRNYAGSFAKLDGYAELNMGAVDGALDLSSRLLPGSNPATLSWPAAGDSSAGQGSIDVELKLNRGAAVDGPFNSLAIGTAADDGDASLAGFDLDVSGDGSADHGLLGSTVIRFGRLLINNAFGPETEPLDMTARTEYWNGNAFVVNDADNCSVFAIDTTPAGPTGISVGSGSTDLSAVSPLSQGDLGLSFSAPGSGNRGAVELRLYDSGGPVSAGISAMPWLLYDWDGDGQHDDDPGSRTATFGRYRGHDRVIYWQESFSN